VPTSYRSKGLALVDVFGFDDRGAYAVGGGGTGSPEGYIFFYDGISAPQQVHPAPGPGLAHPFYSIHGFSPNHVVAVGEGIISRFDGSQWQNEIVPYDLRGVWVIDARTALAVGQDGVVVRIEDGKIAEVLRQEGGMGLNKVFAPSVNSIIVVGDNWLLDFDGSWHTTPAWAPMYSLWGTSASNVFAVGANSLHDGGAYFNGSEWLVMPVTTSLNVGTLYDVWGTGPTTVTAVGSTSGAGGRGQLLRCAP
jgi:hypothetical protein